MARHVHIHMSTRDAGFKESDHPRKDNGEFGKGSGKSDFAKAREAEYDDRRDAAHAAGKTAAAARIKMLEGQLKNLDPKAPLRAKAKIIKELESLGWKDKTPKPDEKPKTGPTTEIKVPLPETKKKAPHKPAVKKQASTTGGNTQAAQALALAKRLGKAADPDDHK